MTNDKYTFTALNEAVAADDKFQDKTHEKVANALFDLMESSEKAVTIGLEGGWGSGKSTVVRFLRSKLGENNDHTLFFLFDAWAHEGDPLRRIFLESLINQIDPEGTNTELVKLKQEIAGRKKVVKVKTDKSTSKLGGFLSLSAILVPVGAAILSAIDYTKVLMPWDLGVNSAHSTLLMALFLTLAPLWVLALWFFFGDKDKDGNKHWDIFSAKSTEDYTQDITEDGERTSIEFEQYFKQIMNSSIGEGKRFERALIVVDNLDRVVPSQTLAIWSILQTFFQHRSNLEVDTESWQSKLWFLIPYDREGLSKVWNKAQPTERNASTEPQEAEPLKDEVAVSFLDKCFQVVAEVPQPVMSAWVSYSAEKIQNSLSGWPEPAVQEVIDTFRRFESSLDFSPTPRQILVFINRVGFLGLRWGNEMSAEAMALYVLIRKNRTEQQLRTDLLKDGLPNNYEGRSSNDELKSQLAGMLFGVNKSKGMELLLEPVIKSALKKGDSGAIQNLVSIHGDGFWVVWQSIKDTSLPKNHHERYRISATQALCGGLSQHKERAAHSIELLVKEWKAVGARWFDGLHGEWNLETYDSSDALQSLINVAPENLALMPWLERLVKQVLKKNIDSLGTDEFNPGALPNLSKLLTLLEKNGYALPPTNYAMLSPQYWKIWQSALSNRSVDFPMILPAEGTISSLAASFDAHNPTVEATSLLITTLSYVPSANGWELVADELVAWSSNPNRVIGNDGAYELMVRVFLGCNKVTREKIATAITSPPFIAKTTQENVSETPSLLVLCAVVLKDKLLSSGLGENIKSYWYKEFDYDDDDQLVSLLRSVGKLDHIWLLTRDSNNKFAINVIRRELFDNELYISCYAPMYVDEFEWASDDEKKEIIVKSAEYGGLSKAREEMLGKPVAYRSCFKIMKSSGVEEAINIVEKVLEKTTAAQWLETLGSDADLFDCLGGKGNHNFKEGFTRFAEKELRESVLSSHVWDRLNIYADKLMDSGDVFEKLTKTYFELEKDPLSDAQFEKFSSLVENHVAEIKSELIGKRIEAWLINSNFNRVSWLLNSDLEYDGTLSESLYSRINSMLIEEENDHKDTLRTLAERLGIDVQADDDLVDMND